MEGYNVISRAWGFLTLGLLERALRGYMGLKG